MVVAAAIERHFLVCSFLRIIAEYSKFEQKKLVCIAVYLGDKMLQNVAEHAGDVLRNGTFFCQTSSKSAKCTVGRVLTAHDGFRRPGFLTGDRERRE